MPAGNRSDTTGSTGSFSLSGLATGQNPLVVTKAIGAAESGSVLSAADALAALKIAVGLNPNSDGRTLSPYQLIAADANEDGRVSAADALAILKMAVKRTDAPVRQWLFVSEGEDFWDHTANNGAGGWTVNRGKVDYDRGDKLVTVSEQGSEVNLVAVLKGDVNGSWQAPANSQDLDVIRPSYFTSLAARLQVPIEQWG